LEDLNSSRVVNKINSFPEQFPQNIAGRRRLFASGTMSDGGGIPIPITFNLNQTIKNDARFNEILRYFKGIRYDIKFTVVIRAAAGTYGAYIAGYQYGPGDASFDALMSSDVWIADIATTEAIEFTVPYRYTHNFLLAETLKDTDYARVFIANVLSRSLEGGTSDVSYQMYYALENVDGAIPTSDNLVYPQSSFHKTGMGGTWVSQAQAVNTLGVVGGAVLDSLYGTDFTSLRQTPTVNAYHPTPSDLTDSGPPSESLESGAKAESKSGKSKGIRQAFFGDMSTLTPEYGVPSLGEEEYPQAVFHPKSMLMSNNMTIKDIGMLPGLYGGGLFTNSTPPGEQLVLRLQLGGERGIATRYARSAASYFARYARYWRGHHKLIFHFFTSPLIAARFKLTVNYSVDPKSGAFTGGNGYEAPTDVFLVKGSTAKSYSFPFMSSHAVIPVQEQYACVTLELLDAPTTFSAVETSVYVLITHSVDDLELYSLQHGLSTETVVPQSSLRHMHRVPAEHDFGGRKNYTSVNMPKIHTVLEIMRRYDDNPNPILSIDTMTTNVGGSSQFYNIYSNLVTASLPFAYISGSVENRLYYDTATTSLKSAMLTNFIENTNAYAANGETLTITPAWPILDFRTPYRASVPMVKREEFGAPPNFQQPNMADVRLSDGEPTRTLVRAGPDFAVHYFNYLPGTGWS